MQHKRDNDERQKEDEQQQADRIGELSLSFCALIAHGVVEQPNIQVSHIEC